MSGRPAIEPDPSRRWFGPALRPGSDQNGATTRNWSRGTLARDGQSASVPQYPPAKGLPVAGYCP